MHKSRLVLISNVQGWLSNGHSYFARRSAFGGQEISHSLESGSSGEKTWMKSVSLGAAYEAKKASLVRT